MSVDMSSTNIKVAHERRMVHALVMHGARVGNEQVTRS